MMAPLPAMTSPISNANTDSPGLTSSSADLGTSNGISLYSVWLQAFVFIDNCAGLRVTPRCQNTTDVNSGASSNFNLARSTAMYRTCERRQNNSDLLSFNEPRFCYYQSSDRQHLLAMHSTTGFLAAVPANNLTLRGSLDKQGFCTRFKEIITSIDGKKTRKTITTACEGSQPARVLAVDGPSVRNSSGRFECKGTGAFVQAGRLEADISNRNKGFFRRQTEFITDSQFTAGQTQDANKLQSCSVQRQQKWKQCYGPQPTRLSYPLIWQSPSNCPINIPSSSPTTTASA